MMAELFASGIWDGGCGICLSEAIGYEDKHIEQKLEEWQDKYDIQFKKDTFTFDWDTFNKEGIEILELIKQKAPTRIGIYYQPVDDRQFFKEEDLDK